MFCQACGKGYTGLNCEIKCPYPLYGKGCQMRCDCIDEVCDPVNGCSQWLSTGIDMIFNFIIITNIPFSAIYKHTAVLSFVYITDFRVSNDSFKRIRLQDGYNKTIGI